MAPRSGRAGPWRNRLAFGFVLVALTGCADSCGPNRVNTDDAVLIEFPDAHHATVTITANQNRWFRPLVEPRGLAAGTATSSTTVATLPQDPDQLRAYLEKNWSLSPGRPVVTDHVAHPRAAMAGIARALGPDARVDSTRVTPYNQIVGHITFPDGLADPLALRPAAVSNALDASGSVWVGICRRWGEGRWSRADNAYDLGHGCAGWVPADRAVSVGTLTSADTHSPLKVPTIWLGLGTVALLGVTIAAVADRRRWWYPLVAVVVVIGTFAAAGQLLAVQYGTTDVAGTFGTALNDGIRDDTGRLLAWAAVLAVGGVVAGCWLALEQAQRRRERRHRMYAVEPFDAGIR